MSLTTYANDTHTKHFPYKGSHLSDVVTCSNQLTLPSLLMAKMTVLGIVCPFEVLVQKCLFFVVISYSNLSFGQQLPRGAENFS